MIKTIGDRVVFTTEEWNALQENGVSFQVKVEANEGIWVDEPIYNKLRKNAVMDNINSTYVNNTNPGIDFSKISSDTNGKGLYVRAGTENDAYPVIYYRGNVDNNVYFAGKCWQIIRTTDTGGTKMIYNGENTGTEDNPACENTEGTARQITLNIDGTDTNTFQYSGPGLYKSPTNVGYMYGSTDYTYLNGVAIDGAYFGNDFIYDETSGVYSLIDAKVGIDENHHYTCNLTTANGTCASIRYYSSYFVGNNEHYNYFTLSNGDSIDDIIDEINVNNNDSNAKMMIDTWYEENMTNYSNKVEDTIYCNDRKIYNLRGFNPNGGLLSADPEINERLWFSSYNRIGISFQPTLNCSSINDSFTQSNEKGNGKLDYRIGLLTADEVMLAGGKLNKTNKVYYLYSNSIFVTSSPSAFMDGASIFFVGSNGSLNYNVVTNKFGIRPVISLKSDTTITEGDGTSGSPFIVK